MPERFKRTEIEVLPVGKIRRLLETALEHDLALLPLLLVETFCGEPQPNKRRLSATHVTVIHRARGRSITVPVIDLLGWVVRIFILRRTVATIPLKNTGRVASSRPVQKTTSNCLRNTSAAGLVRTGVTAIHRQVHQ